MCSSNVHYEPNPSFHDTPFVSELAHQRRRQRGEAGRSAGAAATSSASTSSLSSSAMTLYHTITQSSSVLSIAVDESRQLLFSGSQAGGIYVWDLVTLQRQTVLRGHESCVLALELAPEHNWLFSSSGDNTVRIWDTQTLRPLYVVYPSEDNVGDIFALKWLAQTQTLYLGCQNTSIQWIDLSSLLGNSSSHEEQSGNTSSPNITVAANISAATLSLPNSRPHKFFDSVPYALSRSVNASSNSANSALSTPSSVISTVSSRQRSTVIASAADPKPLTFSASFDQSRSTDRVLRAASLRLDATTIYNHSDQPTSQPSIPVTDSHSRSQQPQQQQLQQQPSADNDDIPDDTKANPSVISLVVPPTCSVPSAHYGYIYCFALLSIDHSDGSDGYPILASGSGDETVKLWQATPNGLVALTTLESPNAEGHAVLALAAWRSTLFAGLQGGQVQVWDLETCTLVRTIEAHTDDILCLETCLVSDSLFTASADGFVRRWDRSFRCTDEIRAHEGIVLSLTPIRLQDGLTEPKGSRITHLVTGSSDDLMRIWEMPTYQQQPYWRRTEPDGAFAVGTPPAVASRLSLPLSVPHSPSLLSSSLADTQRQVPESSLMLSKLSQFVSFKSVSSQEDNREDCRQAAHFLKACLIGLGAEAKVLPNHMGRNPLVLATFSANASRSGYVRKAPPVDGFNRSRSGSSSVVSDDASASLSSSLVLSDDSFTPTKERKRCLFYGHYDCIAAEGSWDSDPFTLTGRDGYLYARGVSDNKGPIIAAACAASQLRSMRRLDVDFVMLIEGEEETGSSGFTDAVRAYKNDIDPIDVILVSNSYWLNEESPCLTVGLRGVVRATIHVSSGETDVHSGVEGGAAREPMVDMVKLLASLSEEDRVTIPGFYERVRPMAEGERREYVAIAQRLGQHATAESLMSRWRFPSLSVHNVRVSGPGNSTIIPSKVSANVSLRIVPDQDLEQIEAALCKHVETEFERIAGSSHRRRNKVSVSVDHRANWWLGNMQSDYFRLLQNAVRDEWQLFPNHQNTRNPPLPQHPSQQSQSQPSTQPQHDHLGLPLTIREGGSIPAIAILEKELDAPAVHLPMGQSSDSAHLPNERIRLINLQKGKQVVRRFLESLGSQSSI